VKRSTKIMIKISLYMQFLTLEKEQHSTKRNVQRILFVYTSSVYFRSFIYWLLKRVKNLSVIIYIWLWLYLEVVFQEQKNINIYNLNYILGNPYGSVFCSKYVVSSVTTSSLTETIPIAMLFPFCCQVSTNCKHLCFHIVANFKVL